MPRKLRAWHCSCSPEVRLSDVNGSVPVSGGGISSGPGQEVGYTATAQTSSQPRMPEPDQKLLSWLLLLKPEAYKLQSIGGARVCIPVTYPSIEKLEQNRSDFKKTAPGIPISLILSAPVQLCNLVCQNLLYRLADEDGLVMNEGVLVPGQCVDVHRMTQQLFKKELFVSVRVLNYSWSNWAKVFTMKHPFNH